MQLADIDQVYEIEKLVQSHPWTKQQFMDSIEPYQCTVIEKDQMVIAFCLMQPVLDEANLLLMAVHPNHQSQGFGSQILEYAIQQLGQGCMQIFLEVRESNLSAIGLYEKLGFHQIDVRKNYYPLAKGGKEHAIIMVNMLNENMFDFKS